MRGIREYRIVERGYDGADRVRAARRKRSRSAMRDVAERLHRLLDALERARPHLVGQRQRARHRGRGDLCKPCDVRQLRGLRSLTLIHSQVSFSRKFGAHT